MLATNQILLDQVSLKLLIKEGLREVLKEERLNLYEILIPYISKKEQHEIEERFGVPADYNEDDFSDMTDWVMK